MMRSIAMPRLGRVLLAAAVVLSLLGAVGGTYWAFGVRNLSLPPSALSPAVSRDSEPRALMGLSYPWQPEQLDAVAKDASIVVEGVIQDILPATWTTDNGGPPSDVRLTFEKGTAHVRTPVRMSVERVYKGANVPSSLVFTVWGGRTGNTAFMTEELERLASGARVIVFLKEHPPFPNTPSRLMPNLFFVIEGSVAHGPIRDIPVSEVARQLP